eukprot:IDg16631t1
MLTSQDWELKHDDVCFLTVLAGSLLPWLKTPEVSPLLLYYPAAPKNVGEKKIADLSPDKQQDEPVSIVSPILKTAATVSVPDLSSGVPPHTDESESNVFSLLSATKLNSKSPPAIVAKKMAETSSRNSGKKSTLPARERPNSS